MAATDPRGPLDLDSMTPEQMRAALRDISRRTGQDDRAEGPQIQDANLALRLRPKVRVTSYMPRGRTGGYRTDIRIQDMKVWVNGIIDPLVNEEFPDRPQVVLVEDLTRDEGDSERVVYRNDALLDEYPLPTSGTVAKRRPGYDEQAPMPAAGIDPEQLKAALLTLGWKPPDGRKRATVGADSS